MGRRRRRRDKKLADDVSEGLWLLLTVSRNGETHALDTRVVCFLAQFGVASGTRDALRLLNTPRPAA